MNFLFNKMLAILAGVTELQYSTRGIKTENLHPFFVFCVNCSINCHLVSISITYD